MLTKDLFVPPSLILHVTFDGLLVSVLPHRVHVEAACPEAPSPEHLFGLGMPVEDMLGCKTLDDLRDDAR